MHTTADQSDDVNPRSWASRRLVAITVALVVAASLGATLTSGHVGYPGRHWEQHAGGPWDYFIPFCFEDGWPGGSSGTSANNVAAGIAKWNDKIGSNGLSIDFRYSRMSDCDDRSDEDFVARIRDLPGGVLGKLDYVFLWDINAGGHLTFSSLLIDNGTGNAHPIFYGGCCPAWQGTADTRYHVQTIAGHEAGHGAILCCSLHEDETFYESELEPTDVNWHSSDPTDLTYTYISIGSLKNASAQEIHWLDLSYPTVD
jgi:hypothetical protein